MTTDELHTLTLTIEIEPSALALLQQQADQQGVTLDQLTARSIGRAAAQAETHAGHIRAANAFNGLVERNQPHPRRPEPEPARPQLRALEQGEGSRTCGYREETTSRDTLLEASQASMPAFMPSRATPWKERMRSTSEITSTPDPSVLEDRRRTAYLLAVASQHQGDTSL